MASIHRIERMNYALAILVTVGGLFITQSRPITLGLMVGSGLTCINFFVLRKLVVKWTTAAQSGKPTGTASMLMMPKMVLLMGAIALAVLLLPIDVIAFTIGYSIFIVSIVVEAVYSALRTPDPAPEPDSESETHNG